MTKKETIAGNIRRKRCKLLERPSVPICYEDLFKIPAHLQKTSDDQDFLVTVSWVDDDDHGKGIYMLFISKYGKHKAVNI